MVQKLPAGHSYSNDLTFRQLYKVLPGWTFTSYIPFFIFNYNTPKKYSEIDHIFIAKFMIRITFLFLLMKIFENLKSHIESNLLIMLWRCVLFLIGMYINISVTVLTSSFLGFELHPPFINLFKARTYHQFLFNLMPFYCTALSNIFQNWFGYINSEKNKIKRSIYLSISVYIAGVILHVPKYLSWTTYNLKNNIFTIYTNNYFLYNFMICFFIFISLITNSMQYNFKNKFIKTALYMTIFFLTLSTASR